ncbi:MAG: hypothetical protein NTY65_02675 [Planctomycetota bacterium]|nr:hypothetical protein [Planctomycetota bacterium]
MRNKWLAFGAFSLAACGLLAMAILTAAEEDPLATTLSQYEAATKKKVNRASGDDLYAVAKWCFQNNRSSEAQAVALEANQKAPDDLRPKYLLYMLTSTGGGEVTPTATTTEDIKYREATITDAEIAEIYKTEVDTAMNGFRGVQQVLINTCGSLKCHGGGNPNSKWVVIRRNATDKKTLAENFRTVNKYIVRGENWADSPLVQKPTKGSEAGHPQIVIRPNDTAYKMITTWLSKSLKTATQNIWGEAGKAPLPTPSK